MAAGKGLPHPISREGLQGPESSIKCKRSLERNSGGEEAMERRTSPLPVVPNPPATLIAQKVDLPPGGGEGLKGLAHMFFWVLQHQLDFFFLFNCINKFSNMEKFSLSIVCGQIYILVFISFISFYNICFERPNYFPLFLISIKRIWRISW